MTTSDSYNDCDNEHTTMMVTMITTMMRITKEDDNDVDDVDYDDHDDDDHENEVDEDEDVDENDKDDNWDLKQGRGRGERKHYFPFLHFRCFRLT